MILLYPIKFENLYYKKVWGGRELESFRNNLPEGNIGESWDVACHSHGMSIVSNGCFKGKTLNELIKLKGSELIGTNISGDWFPLLVKIMNVRDKLSVQVHPNDEYAKRSENDMGKTEVWYVVDAFEGASLLLGLKDKLNKEELKKVIQEGNLENYMNRVPIKKGETYFIQSGLLHTICEEAVIAEIQQNSDTTYRVYDYNRGRELHLEKALDVVNFNLKASKSTGIRVDFEGYHKIYLCLSNEFSLELYDIKDKFTECSDLERFYIFTCVDGQGEILFNHGVEKIKMGESTLIPASLGTYTFKGVIKVLKSYVPNVYKVQQDIINKTKKF